ncbi:hypothetical protein GWP43_06675 [Treponema vincentii]|uniref:Lipoprotein n=1 Tax=Treponema vincentii TaxID=69710 RepID=A0A6P1Y0A6_9SPIR|nr:hypothetical protein [Treponema vincentii]QHX43177.1 hypothetical protein GWP43_06675 [Treponema vincentii]
MHIFKPIVILLCIVCSAIFLNACSHIKEDSEMIIKYLDNRFGKDAYTIKKDKYYRRWLVTLNEYPDLIIFYTVSRDPLSMTSPSIKTNFDEIFGEYIIEEYKKNYELGNDEIFWEIPINFIYYTKVRSLEELKVPYDRAMEFIAFVSEKHPMLIDERLLNIRMDIDGIRLKGVADNDSMIYLDISEVKNDGLSITAYEDICKELTPKLKTHSDNPNGFTFHADIGKSCILGSDTFEDCFFKNLIVKQGTIEELKKIILQPGEISNAYIFKSDNQYEFTNITLQAKNLSDSPCSLLEATIVKAIIDDAKEIYIEPVWIDLVFDKRREWKEPYEVLGISPPKTEQENMEGVQYKNIKILFEMNQYYKEVKRITLTFL